MAIHIRRPQLLLALLQCVHLVVAFRRSGPAKSAAVQSDSGVQRDNATDHWAADWTTGHWWRSLQKVASKTWLNVAPCAKCCCEFGDRAFPKKDWDGTQCGKYGRTRYKDCDSCHQYDRMDSCPATSDDLCCAVDLGGPTWSLLRFSLFGSDFDDDPSSAFNRGKCESRVMNYYKDKTIGGRPIVAIEPSVSAQCCYNHVHPDVLRALPGQVLMANLSSYKVADGPPHGDCTAYKVGDGTNQSNPSPPSNQSVVVTDFDFLKSIELTDPVSSMTTTTPLNHVETRSSLESPLAVAVKSVEAHETPARSDGVRRYGMGCKPLATLLGVWAVVSSWRLL